MAIINIPGLVPTDVDSLPIPVGISVLGTPIYDNVLFEPGRYTDLEGNVVEYDGIQIDTAKITISQVVNLVQTQVSGLNGSIVERISEGDYIISVSCKINELLNTCLTPRLPLWS